MAAGKGGRDEESRDSTGGGGGGGASPYSRCQRIPCGGEYSTTVPSSTPLLTSKKDLYYSHEDTVKLCAQFVMHLCYTYLDLPPLSMTVPPTLSPPLANFISYYALYYTRLHTSAVTFATLYLL